VSIEITKRPDFRKLSEDIKKNIARGMETAGQDELTEISRRSQSDGVDVNGRAFKAYTAAYAKFKAKKDRSLRPDLNLSGDMFRFMNGVEVKRAAGKIVLRMFFKGDAKQASKAKGNMKKRRFFALSRKQVQSIVQTIGEAINGNR
jgi:hypothetical protein